MQVGREESMALQGEEGPQLIRIRRGSVGGSPYGEGGQEGGMARIRVSYIRDATASALFGLQGSRLARTFFRVTQIGRPARFLGNGNKEGPRRAHFLGRCK